MAAAALVGYPLSILMYWLLHPAYGKSGTTAILHAKRSPAYGHVLAEPIRNAACR